MLALSVVAVNGRKEELIKSPLQILEDRRKLRKEADRARRKVGVSQSREKGIKDKSTELQTVVSQGANVAFLFCADMETERADAKKTDAAWEHNLEAIKRKFL